MRLNHPLSFLFGLFLLAFLPGCASTTDGVPVSGAVGIDTRPTEDPIGVSPDAYASAPTTMVRCGTLPVVVVWHQFKDAAVYDFVADRDSSSRQLAFYLIVRKVGENEIVTYQFLHTGRPSDFLNIVNPHPHTDTEARRLAGAVLDPYLAPEMTGDEAFKTCNDAIREMHAEYRTRA